MKPPQLTLRDLFWLVLVVAMACAWTVEYRSKMRQTEAFRNSLLEMGLENMQMMHELESLRGLKPLAP